jgi:hypothetical protein
MLVSPVYYCRPINLFRVRCQAVPTLVNLIGVPWFMSTLGLAIMHNVPGAKP